MTTFERGNIVIRTERLAVQTRETKMCIKWYILTAHDFLYYRQLARTTRVFSQFPAWGTFHFTHNSYWYQQRPSSHHPIVPTVHSQTKLLTCRFLSLSTRQDLCLRSIDSFPLLPSVPLMRIPRSPPAARCLLQCGITILGSKRKAN